MGCLKGCMFSRDVLTAASWDAFAKDALDVDLDSKPTLDDGARASASPSERRSGMKTNRNRRISTRERRQTSERRGRCGRWNQRWMGICSSSSWTRERDDG